jgi:hypothetical protein
MALAPNPQLSAGGGTMANGMISAAPTDDPNYQVDPIQQFGVPSGFGLPMQIGLPSQSSPLGQYTDSQYLSDDSALRAQIGQQYAQILQQLGYMDPNSGSVIPGSVVQDANIQAAQEQQAEQDALRSTVGQMQNAGTLFSGYRGTATLQALYPHQQNIAQLGLNTQRTLNDLYNQAQNLVTNYNVQNQQNLSSAAQRNLQNIMNAQMLGGGGGGGGDGGSTDVTSTGGYISTGQSALNEQGNPSGVTPLQALQNQGMTHQLAVQNVNKPVQNLPGNFAPAAPKTAINPYAGQVARNVRVG